MNDKRLVELYYLYGKFAYGTAYYNLIMKGIEFNYENIKNEIELNISSNICENNVKLVKTR